MFKKRELAERTWELTENGISVRCRCEKEHACTAHGFIHRPSELEGIEMQMERFIRQLWVEYRVPEKKVRYYHVRQGQPFDVPKLKLPARWKDPEVLGSPRQGFDKLRMTMKITFLGGADEVGASSILVEIGGKRMLVDCGIRPSPKARGGLAGDQLPDLDSSSRQAGCHPGHPRPHRPHRRARTGHRAVS